MREAAPAQNFSGGVQQDHGMPLGAEIDAHEKPERIGHGRTTS
jgi:hypothetical protein